MSDKDKRETHPESSDAPVDPKYLREIADLVNETGMAEIEVRRGDLKIRVSRLGGMSAPVSHPLMPAVASTASPANPASTATDAGSNPGILHSPMVGTVYRRSAPEAKPFIEIGTVVKAGDRVLLVEAMKTFNDILAHRSGAIASIMVEDGQPVEFGQPLLVIE